MEEIPTYVSCKWPFPTSPWQEGWSCCQGSEIRCANQQVQFSVPQNLEDATLQRNYGQLPRDTASFSFIIARDKFSRYYRENPQPPARCQGQNYQHFCPNRTGGVKTTVQWQIPTGGCCMSSFFQKSCHPSNGFMVSKRCLLLRELSQAQQMSAKGKVLQVANGKKGVSQRTVNGRATWRPGQLGIILPVQCKQFYNGKKLWNP